MSAAGAAAGTERIDARLQATREAFDSVAPFYDGPFGNNALIERMRGGLLRAIAESVPAGARLLDLGCGTGIDAERLARAGYSVVATDASPEMVARTRARVTAAGLGDRVRAITIGIEELDRLDEAPFAAIYSDLGPLNCVPDLAPVAERCGSLLTRRGRLLASVMGRACPWEIAYYILRGDLVRARVRFARGLVPVGLNGRTVWTRYYTPREFYAAFSDRFEMIESRALGLFLPPPYLVRVHERYPRVTRALGWLDDRAGALPFFRGAGDHFLTVLVKRD